jgi:Yip1 domain
MDLTFAGLLRQVQLTLQSPRDGARQMMAIDLTLQGRWTALFLMAVLSAIVTSAFFFLVASTIPGVALPSPWTLAVTQTGVMVLSALLVHRIGVWRGGKGRLADAVILMAWLQFILLCLQVLQMVVLLISPQVSDIIGFAGVAVFFWLLTVFVAEMHGFPSLGRVFLGILVTILAVAFALSMVLVLFVGPIA